MNEQFEVGDGVMVRPGEIFDEFEADMSGWRGWIVDVDPEDGDLLIAWNAQTLRDIPETAVAALLQDEMDWTCMYVEPEAVLAWELPDEAIEEMLAVARARTAVYDLSFDDLTDNPLFEEMLEIDLGDRIFGGGAWEEDAPPFDLDEFLALLEIPPKEHEPIRRALGSGLETYYQDIYGYRKYGKQPMHLIRDRMGEPFIFGYGALEIWQRKRISLETKLKVCQYATEILNPGAEYGMPHGLVTILGHLAAAGALEVGRFFYVMMAMEYGGVGAFQRSIWQHGTTREAVLALLDWLAASEEFSDDEKSWWVWRWSLACDFDVHLVRAVAQDWLARETVPDDQKWQLCRGWLKEAEEIGTPPKAWQMMTAYMAGDRDQLAQLVQDVGGDLSDLPAPDEMPPPVDDREMGFMQEMLLERWRIGMVSPALKRLSIPKLVELGEGPLELVDELWDTPNEFDYDSIFGGIVEVLRTHAAALPPAELRQRVERGLAAGRVQARKRFHVLARELYGDEFLPLALQDNAKSLRDWAKKVQKK